jgi:hypothetical protein
VAVNQHRSAVLTTPVSHATFTARATINGNVFRLAR